VAGELREAGIPFAFYKRQTLFESAEARMITDVLRAILNPDRPNVRHKAFVTPFFDIKEREIAKAGLVMPNHPAMLFLLSLHEDARQGKAPNAAPPGTGIGCVPAPGVLCVHPPRCHQL
jgi:exodeoxyribonuclease V beta subunit